MQLKKTNSVLQQGIIYMPYIICETVQVISGSFSPRQTLRSRYSTSFSFKNSRRKKSIDIIRDLIKS